MATFAISDIHGCFDEFLDLLELIDFTSSDKLYILGDVIDRGPKIAEMISFLATKPDNILLQWGNHEKMMQWSFVEDWGDLDPDFSYFDKWLEVGGKETFEQIQAIPDKHLNRFYDIVFAAPYIRVGRVGDDDVIFAHAGLHVPDKEGLPLTYEDIAEQTSSDIIWGCPEWYANSSVLPCHVVFGHVPTSVLSKPDFLKDDGSGESAAFRCRDEEVLSEGRQNHIMQYRNRHAIDCGCVHGGKLGCLRLDDWKAFHVPCRKEGGYNGALK